MAQQLESMERFLRAQAVVDKTRGKTQRPEERPFVTISRQAGAGGHDLADKLAARLNAKTEDGLFGGWQVFDHRLCRVVAEDPNYSHTLDDLVNEDYRTRADEFFQSLFRSSVDQRAVMERVFRVVRAVASVGKAIIIGRAGAQVTKDMGPGISIRLIAPEVVRIKGVMDFYGLDEKEARAESKRLDTGRARLLKTHFGVDIEDPTQYDAVLNTGKVSIDSIADVVVVMLQHEISAAAASDRV